MPLLWFGIVLLLLKLLDVGPVANLSWWWVLLPFGGAFLWFETFEALVGRDKRQREHDHYNKLREERVAKQFSQNGNKRAP